MTPEQKYNRALDAALHDYKTAGAELAQSMPVQSLSFFDTSDAASRYRHAAAELAETYRLAANAAFYGYVAAKESGQ